MAKQKHLTEDERRSIEDSLNRRDSLAYIAGAIGKDKTTISREIKKHAKPGSKPTGAGYRNKNKCEKRYHCDKYQLCIGNADCTRKCSTCAQCNSVCPGFVEEICPKLSQTPYVCNGCPDGNVCTLGKRYYHYNAAYKEYRTTLVSIREGVNISEESLASLNSVVSPLIRKGQSVHHIIANNPDKFSYCEKSIYSYINYRLLDARNIDMPRVCRLKPRKKKSLEHKVDKGCRIGRTYDDFKASVQAHPDVTVVEMDSVEGNKGGKVLLTLHFVNCCLMLAFIRDSNDSQSVIDIINDLYDLLGAALFRKLMPLLLGDRGSEFSDPCALETAPDGTARSRVFYCDPNSPYQKPDIELNHELIRRILPKGKSFNNLTQDDINLMMSHINSYSREKLNDKSPLSAFSFLYGEGVAGILGIQHISPNDIVLRPDLLKK